MIFEIGILDCIAPVIDKTISAYSLKLRCTLSLRRIRIPKDGSKLKKNPTIFFLLKEF